MLVDGCYRRFRQPAITVPERSRHLHAEVENEIGLSVNLHLLADIFDLLYVIRPVNGPSAIERIHPGQD